MYFSKCFSKFQNYWISDQEFRKIIYSQYIWDITEIRGKIGFTKIFSSYCDLFPGWQNYNWPVCYFLHGLLNLPSPNFNGKLVDFYQFGLEAGLRGEWVKFLRGSKLKFDSLSLPGEIIFSLGSKKIEIECSKLSRNQNLIYSLGLDCSSPEILDNARNLISKLPSSNEKK